VNTTGSSASFAFDSGLMPAGGGQIQDVTGLGATYIDFFCGRTHWTTANADVAELFLQSIW